ncbi:MAG: hypothetical protein V9G13_14660 [Marmoricola sp.]
MTLLEAQTYVQRNGNVYEYLTNEEQVIEEEIKNVDIDASEVSAQLFKILSGDVIKTNKIRYAKNGQDFPFGFKLDDQVHGPQKELSVHFITPEYPYTPERDPDAQRGQGRAARHPRTRRARAFGPASAAQDRQVHQAQADHLAVSDRGADPPARRPR